MTEPLVGLYSNVPCYGELMLSPQRDLSQQLTRWFEWYVNPKYHGRGVPEGPQTAYVERKLSMVLGVYDVFRCEEDAFRFALAHESMIDRALEGLAWKAVGKYAEARYPYVALVGEGNVSLEVRFWSRY